MLQIMQKIMLMKSNGGPSVISTVFLLKQKKTPRLDHNEAFQNILEAGNFTLHILQKNKENSQ